MLPNSIFLLRHSIASTGKGHLGHLKSLIVKQWIQLRCLLAAMNNGCYAHCGYIIMKEEY